MSQTNPLTGTRVLEYTMKRVENGDIVKCMDNGLIERSFVRKQRIYQTLYRVKEGVGLAN